MTVQANPKHALGVAMKRKEDPRFLQGKGQYVEDIMLPGMLHMAIVRSTYPHAEIVSIDISNALKVPGVKAVITGKDLEAADDGHVQHAGKHDVFDVLPLALQEARIFLALHRDAQRVFGVGLDGHHLSPVHLKDPCRSQQ